MTKQTIYYNTTDFGLIAISGDDAEKFLQGQLSCDVASINESNASLGVHCDHKGRIIAAFLLIFHNNNYYLLLPKNIIEPTLTALKKYAVFSKVELNDASTALSDLSSIFAKHASLSEDARLENIKEGTPFIYSETLECFTPHSINYHLLDGISFTKGCYTGQEIIARMQYLGKLKEQMYQIETGATAQAGAPLLSEGKTVGTLVDAVTIGNTTRGLAVIKNKAIGSTILLGDHAVTKTTLPAYAETK